MVFFAWGLGFGLAGAVALDVGLWYRFWRGEFDKW